MINKDGGGDNFYILWGDTAVMRGNIEHMGVPPVPPLGNCENPGMKSRPNIKMILNCCGEALKPGSCQHIGHISLPCT